MKLTECLNEKTVEAGAKVSDKASALSRLVDLVLAGGRFMEPIVLLEEMEKREKLGSTGIGMGVAIPHVHLNGVEGLHVAMMTVPGGVDFDAIDDLPCSIFIMVVAPDEDREGYLKLLSEVSRLMRNEKVRDALLAAKSPAEFLKTLAAAES